MTLKAQRVTVTWTHQAERAGQIRDIAPNSKVYEGDAAEQAIRESGNLSDIIPVEGVGNGWGAYLIYRRRDTGAETCWLTNGHFVW